MKRPAHDDERMKEKKITFFFSGLIRIWSATPSFVPYFLFFSRDFYVYVLFGLERRSLDAGNHVSIHLLVVVVDFEALASLKIYINECVNKCQGIRISIYIGPL